jgi:hypothetical protein
VPKPIRPIFSRLSALADFFTARDLTAFDERDDVRDFRNDLSSGHSSYQTLEKSRRRKAV